MLSTEIYQVYQGFLTELVNLQEHLNYFDQDLASFELISRKVKDIFENKIVNLSFEGLESDRVGRCQLMHIELHRAFRLLETDLIFLRSAKQSATILQRKTKVSDRLEKLINDGKFLLEFLII